MPSGVYLGLQDSDVREIAITLIIVEPIADHKSIRNFEAGVFRVDIRLPACRFVQQGYNVDRRRLTDFQVLF